MELLQLKYFCDAAESQNFSRTAQKHNVPPSNISQTVKRLEDELGVKLFVRSANRILLSEQGRLFYNGVKEALATIECARMSVTDPDGELSGEIKLLIRTHRRTTALAIEKFKAEYPKVRIVINHNTGAEFSDYNFIISDGAEHKDRYKRELLLTEKILLAVYKTHPMASEGRVKLSTLADESFISMTPDSRFAEFSFAICRSEGFVPNVAISAEDPYYVRKYVEMGLGVALVPSVSWRGLFTSDARLVDIGDYNREIFLYSRTDSPPSRTELAFAEMLREAFLAESEKSATRAD